MSKANKSNQAKPSTRTSPSPGGHAARSRASPRHPDAGTSTTGNAPNPRLSPGQNAMNKSISPRKVNGTRPHSRHEDFDLVSEAQSNSQIRVIDADLIKNAGIHGLVYEQQREFHASHTPDSPPLVAPRSHHPVSTRRTSAMSESSSDLTEPEAYMNLTQKPKQDSTFTPVTHYYNNNGHQLNADMLLSYFRRAPAEDLEYIYSELNHIMLSRHQQPAEEGKPSSNMKRCRSGPAVLTANSRVVTTNSAAQHSSAAPLDLLDEELCRYHDPNDMGVYVVAAAGKSKSRSGSSRGSSSADTPIINKNGSEVCPTVFRSDAPVSVPPKSTTEVVPLKHERLEAVLSPQNVLRASPHSAFDDCSVSSSSSILSGHSKRAEHRRLHRLLS